MGLRDAGQGIGPRQRRAFSRRVERRFVPGIEQIKTLLALALAASVLAVHVETVCAAVDLRGAHLDQLYEAPLQATLLNIRLGLLYHLHRRGCCFVGIQSRRLHSALLSDWPQVLAMVQIS